MNVTTSNVITRYIPLFQALRGYTSIPKPDRAKIRLRYFFTLSALEQDPKIRDRLETYARHEEAKTG